MVRVHVERHSFACTHAFSLSPQSITHTRIMLCICASFNMYLACIKFGWDEQCHSTALSLCLVNSLSLQDPAFLRQCVQKFCRLVSSPKSVECNAASSIVRFLMHRKPEELNTLLESHLRGQCKFNYCYNVLSVFCFIKYSVNIMCTLLTATDAEGWQQETQKQPHWATVHILCDLLKSHVRIARGDLVSCSVTHPMYGVLQSIRAVLEESLLL